MKFKLKKKQLKNLSKDNKSLPENMTPQVGGGTIPPLTTPPLISMLICSEK